MKKVFYVFLATALFCIIVLTGCMPEKEKEKEAEAPITVTVETPLSLYGIDPHTLDPAVSGEMTSHEYIMQIFSGLVRLDENLEPAPDISREWKVSKDGRTYTFYLNRNVKFHNGQEVKAGDVKYSWERACSPDTGSHTAATYLGDIVGAKEMLAGVSKDISGVRVLDDYTLEVTIEAPRSYFLFKLCYPTAFVVDKANVKSGGVWWKRPNGTGPFKLKQWSENELLVLERNELYYGEVPKIPSVNYHLWAGVPMRMYETGEIDVTSVYLDYIDRVTDEAGPFYRDLEIVPELSLNYIGFNCSRPPFDDVNIRRAFTMAIDKDKLVSLVYRDMVARADGILPPGIPGFNEVLSGLHYDVEGARQLIKASRYGDVSALPPITITTAGWGGQISQALEAIVHEWRTNLGVNVKVRQLEPEWFFYNLMEEKDEMYITGWIADYPHPQNFLEVLFGSGVENNYGEYSNPEVDELLERAGMEMDSGRSLKMYQEVEQKLVDDAACLPLWFGENYILVKSYVKGYRLNGMGLSNLGSVYVEEH
jgi:oligopeptide transport system substrate-binding protein